MDSAESAEVRLSYASDQLESGRKRSGSYYTPADVADFFWDIFFSRSGITTPNDACEMLNKHVFVEPSVGAGALFLSLIKKLLIIGLSPIQLQKIQAVLVDLNTTALDFTSAKLRELERVWSIRFENIALINNDYRDCDLKIANPIFFANPPFVANVQGISKWKNVFADFIELSLARGDESRSLHFIAPLSLAFSRDYSDLREILRQAKMHISIASFDNMPDTLFKSGKPKHTNTNKANSQRCCILTVLPAESSKISSTKLHRWSRGERGNLFSRPPNFSDVTDYNFDDQFPRPVSEVVPQYLKNSSNSKTFASLISGSGELRLYVAPVARNYIGFREEQGTNCHDLCFGTKNEFFKALGVLSSELFFEYWLTVGDGFHLTKANILNFPLVQPFEGHVEGKLRTIEIMWGRRKYFEKIKLNSGKQMRSFDFSVAALKLNAIVSSEG